MISISNNITRTQDNFEVGKMTFFKFKFDFEIGNLIKSPCKECEKRKRFPKCIDECKMLDKIQNILAETRSCSKSRG